MQNLLQAQNSVKKSARERFSNLALIKPHLALCLKARQLSAYRIRLLPLGLRQSILNIIAIPDFLCFAMIGGIKLLEILSGKAVAPHKCQASFLHHAAR